MTTRHIHGLDCADEAAELCLRSDISRESIMIRKTCSFFLKLDNNDERHRR